LPWEKNTYRPFYDDWQRIISAAGLPKGTKPVPKNFRSTCGSEMIDVGIPTVVVKDFLGHASVTTTEAFYIDTGPALRNASEKRRGMHD
jgi:integrase